MKIYVFGNIDESVDKSAILIAKELSKKLKVEFVFHNPVEDFNPDEKDIIILDTAIGIDKVSVITDLEKLEKSPTLSLHDFDIAFNLKLLVKLNKLNSVKIIAVPSHLDIEVCIAEVETIISLLSS